MNGPAGSPPAPTVLETRYRRLLRVLPAAYRRRWEEEMVATFLASMATDDPDEAEFLAYCGRPGWSERASVVGLSLRLRLGGTDAPATAFLSGEATRRLALVLLLVNALGATAMLAQQAWIAGLVPWPPVPEHIAAIADDARPLPLDAVATVAWAAAYGSLVLGKWRRAKWLAALAFLPSIIGAITATVTLLVARSPLPWLPVAAHWLELVLMGLLLVSLAAFHHGAPPVRPRPWVLALAIGVPAAALAQIGLLVVPAFPGPLLLPSGAWSVALLVLSALALTGKGFTDVRGWTLTLAMLAAGVAGMRGMVLLPQLVSPGGSARAGSFALVEVLGLVTVAGVLTTRARRDLQDTTDQPRPAPLPMTGP